MSNYNFSDMRKPSIFTAQNYGTKTSVEIDHSDLDFNEVMDAFHTLIVGMGFSADTWKQWIMERAAEYQEEEDLENQFEIDEDSENEFEPNEDLNNAAYSYKEVLTSNKLNQPKFDYFRKNNK